MNTANSPTADVVIEPSNISVDNNVQSNTTDDTAVSSTANQLEGAKQEKSTLEMVKEALKPTEPSQDATQATVSPTDAGQGNQPEGEAEKKVATTNSEETDKKLPFHNHPRWKEVIEENKSLKAQAVEYEALKQQATELQERASRFDVVADFVNQNGLEGQEIDLGFQVMAAIKSATSFGGDPKAALDILMPIVTDLQQLSGDVMPEDLQKKIDDGYVDEETAREIARLRAQNGRTEQRATMATKQVEAVTQQTQQAQEEQSRNAMISEVTKWEANWKATDPDYARKQPMVQAEIALLKTKHGSPRNAQEAVYLADYAKAAVDKRLKELLPPKAEMKTVTGGRQNGSPAPRANNAIEAARQALRGEYKLQSPSS